ncbi:MAG: hypothetical protein ACRD0I_10695 [Acidimicrobiales bacterium]
MWITTSNFGQTWTLHRVSDPSVNALTAVSCTTIGRCLALGPVGLAQPLPVSPMPQRGGIIGALEGNSFVPVPLAGGTPKLGIEAAGIGFAYGAISCPDATHCYAEVPGSLAQGDVANNWFIMATQPHD